MALNCVFSSQKSEQTARKHMTRCFMFVVMLFLLFDSVECRVCTRMTMERKTVVDKHVDQCTQSYKATCGWFSSEMCTFYEKVECIKEENRTMTIYRIVEECCPGYAKNQDGRCMQKSAVEGQSSDRDNDDDDDEKFFLGLSHGAYAGIVCGILFVACVALLTALHYRKRRRRQKKMSTIRMEQEVAQQQQMLPLQKMDTEPAPA